jgi:hypothetical protein
MLRCFRLDSQRLLVFGHLRLLTWAERLTRARATRSVMRRLHQARQHTVSILHAAGKGGILSHSCFWLGTTGRMVVVVVVVVVAIRRAGMFMSDGGDAVASVGVVVVLVGRGFVVETGPRG